MSILEDEDEEDFSTAGILQRALLSESQSQEEKVNLQSYKNTMEKIDDLDESISELENEINELVFDEDELDVNRITELKSEISKTEIEIRECYKKLCELEETKPLQDLIAREVKRMREKSNEKGRELMRREWERRGTVRTFDSARNRAKSIFTRMADPTDSKNIDEG